MSVGGLITIVRDPTTSRVVKSNQPGVDHELTAYNKRYVGGHVDLKMASMVLHKSWARSSTGRGFV